MSDIKISLTVLVQGATIMSEQECSKQLKKPVINKKGKYAGKQARDKEGNPLYYYESVPDFTKFNRYDIRIDSKGGKKETITYFTRKSREVRQIINMSEEAYNYFISVEMPQGYQAPNGYRAHLDKKSKNLIEVPLDIQSWRELSKKQRLEWHLNAICENMRGKMESYTVFND